MKVGYPCLNRTLECTSSRTFRLKNYGEKRLKETVEDNLECLKKILAFNVKNDLYFFRITSDLVPFASHPVCEFDWQGYFKDGFREIGDYIEENDVRISMHPDQFIVLNSNKEEVYDRAVMELVYHADVLDSMNLKTDAKIQLHVGGVYGDKEKSIERFIERYGELEPKVKRRLVIENDDRSYCLRDCLDIHQDTGVPILFDSFHHELNNSGEPLERAFELFTSTWKKQDGLPMVDYSSQRTGGKRGSHAESIDPAHFRSFLDDTSNYDFDLMLEIKDKERSALKALDIIPRDRL